MQQLVSPVGASLQAAQALTEGRRGPAFNHYKAAADALQSLSWVVYTGPNCGAPAWQLLTLSLLNFSQAVRCKTLSYFRQVGCRPCKPAIMQW